MAKVIENKIVISNVKIDDYITIIFKKGPLARGQVEEIEKDTLTIGGRIINKDEVKMVRIFTC